MTLEEAKERIQESLKRSREDVDNYCDDGSRGEVTAYENALSILNRVDTEPVVIPNKMTLTELAHELRKLFKFKYLGYGEVFCFGLAYNAITISDKPLHLEIRDEGGEGCPCYIHEWNSEEIKDVFYPEDLAFSLDLSEYADEDGEIDYSKCIVEV